MAERDYYTALGVSRDANQDEIQRAYRTLARRLHPDVSTDPEAEERFKEVVEAHRVLSNPRLRERYDGRQEPPGERVWVGSDSGSPFGSGFDLADLIGTFLGAHAKPEPARGADQEAELELTVEEAFRGGPRPVTLPAGAQWRRLRVAIPPGVVDGQRIRLSGRGAAGEGDGPAGDLFLVIRLMPHQRYRLDGRDITVDLPLTPWEAALGGSVSLETPGGTVTLTVPPGTSSGRRLRVRGRGFPNPQGDPGDLYAEARILVPDHLSDTERRLFTELAAASDFNPRAPLS
ncbi:DnaJ domain-containing protein [Nocardia huaxiensis]|uniref:DnaJ domain-containing protein n=1 Tax=Nocardia huaxiensis TaxID=2755382 RepID=A0A7D6VF36_9NOCA|nr:DnaJ C-terminal domain-containing protein [Nocardia huaxiensis]QLY33533.1 DnaJ domain-containing protein [Nocardia huaxiensis]